MKRLLWCMTASLVMVSGLAQDAKWPRYAAISPQGDRVVFSYRGDLWLVQAKGGLATPLTLHEAYDFCPVWSADGQHIAFSSDRYGNFDVFLMSLDGGDTKRLTFHSAHDRPCSFTPNGRAVLFSSTRLDAASCAQIPHRDQPELYRISVQGGMPVQVLTTPAMHAVFDATQSRLAYSDQKGMEDPWRKHDDSSFARDVWLWDVASNVHTKLTDFGVDDRQPVWGPDQQCLFFLSERSGNFNVWRMEVQHPETATQITHHTTHPVRFLSSSAKGDLCYVYDGQIWIRPANSSNGHTIDITFTTDGRNTSWRTIDVAREISEFDVSPDGSEIAFIARGEIFVTSAKHATTRQITHTPEQERSVSFSPDGRSLIYASERNGSWNLYRTDLKDDSELNFFNGTAMTETPVLVDEAEAFQPSFSPDGKQVAFLQERTELRVIDLASNESRTVLTKDANYSYADGDQWYSWSPDGLWFLVNFLSPGRWSNEAGLVAASGKESVINLTKSGYEDFGPRWAMKGEAFFWLTDRHGRRGHAGNLSETDVYLAFFTDKAWDSFRMSEAELEQKKKAEEKAKEKEEDKDQDSKKKKKKKAQEKDEEKDDSQPKLADPVNIDLDGLEDRKVRLSLHSARMSDAALSPDGEKLFYLAVFEKGFDLWQYAHRKKEIKLLAKLNAKRAGNLHLDKEGKQAFLLADRKLMCVELESGKVSPVKLSATLQLDAAAERAYMFEHAWRQMKKKFYSEEMHGQDWDALKRYYLQYLDDIETNWDFAEFLSEMLGELNASHTGASHRPKRTHGDDTASLAFFPDPNYDGPGISIQEIIDGSPLRTSGSKITPGVVIEVIDNVSIAQGENWYPLLNQKAGTRIRLSLFDPQNNTRWQETVKPISRRQLASLLYERWVRSRRQTVEDLSDGRIGYAHIRSMMDFSYREIFEDIFGKALDKEAIVLDTRFNNGGNLVEPLTAFLSGEHYFSNVPRGRMIGQEPSLRWAKPSIVVVNEGNYSDAHCFPMAYTQMKLGETVGMPVPGTCTAVWWETLQDRSLYFGIPQVGVTNLEGEFLENKHHVPDHVQDNDPALEAEGRDQQLEKAVEVLLEKLSQ